MESLLILFVLLLVIVLLFVMVYTSKRLSDVDRKATAASESGPTVARYDSALLTTAAGKMVPRTHYYVSVTGWGFSVEGGSNVQTLRIGSSAQQDRLLIDLEGGRAGMQVYRAPDSVQYAVKSAVAEGEGLSLVVYGSSNAATAGQGLMGTNAVPATGSNLMVTLTMVPEKVVSVA